MYKTPGAQSVKELVTQLRDLHRSHSAALEDGRMDDAQDLLDQQSVLEAQLEKMRTGWDRANSPVVTAEDIAELVSMWTGVPLTQLKQEESERLLHMEEELRKQIVGQEEAIELIPRQFGVPALA